MSQQAVDHFRMAQSRGNEEWRELSGTARIHRGPPAEQKPSALHAPGIGGVMERCQTIAIRYNGRQGEGGAEEEVEGPRMPLPCGEVKD
jgi:hypothetical protein